MSYVMNRPWSFSEKSVASYSMLIGGTWTASIHDKRTHSSMYSFNFTQFCNSGKSYKVLHSCLLTSFKAKKEEKCWKSPYEVIRHLFTHGRNDGVKGMSRGLSERKQLIERGACSAGETVYSVHIKYNFSKSNKMYRLSFYLQDFRHYCLGLSPSALFWIPQDNLHFKIEFE